MKIIQHDKRIDECEKIYHTRCIDVLARTFLRHLNTAFPQRKMALDDIKLLNVRHHAKQHGDQSGAREGFNKTEE